MPGKAVSPAVATELQRQFNYELSAAHSYLALAIWCDQENLKGFAEFFHKQAEEEREHADKIMDHLLDRGVYPIVKELSAPRTQFESIIDIAKQAQSMEQANTRGIVAAYEAALKESDYPAQVMLQWFISEQVEEEAWTDEMVDRVARANCAGGLGELDRHIIKYMTEKSED